MREDFETLYSRIKILLCTTLLCLVTGMGIQAGDSIESAGDILTVLLPATAAGLTVGFKDGTGALQLGLSAALTLGVTSGLKNIVNETDRNGDNHHAFPSAHTSISFASAEFMRKRYGWEYGIPAYAAATFVAASRVEAKDHYVHDVLAGAFIGIASSYLFTQPYKGWHIRLEVDQKNYGIRLGRIW